MLDKKIEVKVGGDFEPVPADKYTVQITDVEAVTQFNKFKGEDTQMLKYQFVILDDKPIPDSEETTKHRYLWARVNPVLSGKSTLMKLTKAVYGRDLTREEMVDFDPELLIGKQVDVMVEQNPSSDGTVIYNNIVSYTKTLKKLEPFMEVQGQTSLNKESTPVEQVKTPDLQPKGALRLEDAFPADEEEDEDEEEQSFEDFLKNGDPVEEDEEVLKAKELLEQAKKKAKKKAKADK